MSALPPFSEHNLPLTSIDTSGLGIYLTSGESFAILAGVTGPDAGLIGWIDFGGGISNAYPGGTAYYSYDGNATFHGGGDDQGFRTFVDPDPRSAVPETASWAMFIGGFGLVGGSLRTRRRLRFA